MRVKVSFSSTEGKPIVLPVQYLYSIHCLIYKMFTPETAQKIYLDGFPYQGKKLKLFSYSRILEKGKIDKKRRVLCFNDTISFYFSCPLPYVVNDFLSNAFATEEIMLFGNNLMLSAFEPVEEPDLNSSSVRITMTSPVTVYSTLDKEDGKKFTYYFAPTDPAFSKLIEENAKRKYGATMTALGIPISNKEVSQMHLRITPQNYNVKYDKKILYFKNKVVEGYTGIYILKGTPELIKITYDCGIGASTSEGFGMWFPV